MAHWLNADKPTLNAVGGKGWATSHSIASCDTQSLQFSGSYLPTRVCFAPCMKTVNSLLHWNSITEAGASFSCFWLCAWPCTKRGLFAMSFSDTFFAVDLYLYYCELYGILQNYFSFSLIWNYSYLCCRYASCTVLSMVLHSSVWAVEISTKYTDL